MTTTMNWQDPPPSMRRGNRDTWPEIAAQLRSNPGKWAKVQDDEKGPGGGVANAIKHGKYRGFEPGEFEAVSRRIDGKNTVFARYIGEVPA